MHSHQTKSKASLLPGTRWSGSGPDSAWHRKVRARLQDSRSAIYLLLHLHLPTLLWRVKQIHWLARISILPAPLPALQLHVLSLTHMTHTRANRCRSLPVPPTITNFLSSLIKATHSFNYQRTYGEHTQSFMHTRTAVSGFQSREIFFPMDTGVLWWLYPPQPCVVIAG